MDPIEKMLKMDDEAILEAMMLPAAGLLSGDGTAYSTGGVSTADVTFKGLLATSRYFDSLERSEGLAAEVPARWRWPLLGQWAGAEDGSRWVDVRAVVDRRSGLYNVPCVACRPDSGFGPGSCPAPIPIVVLSRHDLTIEGWLRLGLYAGRCGRCGTGYWA